MKKKYLKGFDDYTKAVKEGLNIYEFEDDVQEPVADLDSETEKAEDIDAPAPTDEAPVDEEPVQDAPTEEVPAEAPVEEPVVDVPTEEAPTLDFGDNGTNLSVDDLTSKLDFIDGVTAEYKKLIKKGETVDPKIQSRIQGAFDSIS